MSLLKKKLSETLPKQAEEVAKFVKDNADAKVSDVTLKQVYGGMRGVKGLVCDTSVVPPNEGLIIRGYPLKELFDKLPEEVLWLLLTGDLPNDEELKDLKKDINDRSVPPDYVWSVIDSMPENSHPMAMFNTAILSMQGESVFAKEYAKGLKKSEFWEYTLEDYLNVMAKLPSIAAYVY